MIITKTKSVFCIFLFLFIALFEINAQDSKPLIEKSKISQKIDGKDYYVHIVAPGQTLFSIARTYNSRYQDAVIKTDIDRISIGDTVWIPFSKDEKELVQKETQYPSNDSNYRFHEVLPKETIYGISRKYNLKEKGLIALNPFLDTVPLKTGHILKVPNIKTVTAEPTPVVTVIKEPYNESDSIAEMPKMIIKDLHNNPTICLALIMPFYLSEASEISISKLDIEQRRKRTYKSFQFIQFYEGMLLALDKLEKQGLQVRLLIYDVNENDTEAIEKIFAQEEFKEVDFIITLLYQKAFEKAASLAMKSNTFILNPLSNRSSIIEKNPYVFKIHASEESYANSALSLISGNFSQPNVFLIHSDKPSEAGLFKAFKTAFESQKTIRYTLFNWSAASSLVTHLKTDKDNIIISIYDDKSQKNQVYVNTLLNRLFSIKNNRPTLFGPSSWLEYENIDYSYLQRLNFHFENNLYLDYSNPVHNAFINLFKETYKTEPNAQLAGLGYDVVLHFITGLHSKGKSFWEDPNIQGPMGLLNPFFFKKNSLNNGYENTRNFFYKLEEYRIVPARRTAQ